MDEQTGLIPPPDESPGLQTLYAIVKGVIAACSPPWIASATGLPVESPWASAAGSIAVEVADTHLNPFDRRNRAWLLKAYEAIRQIESRFNVLPSELANDERFLSMLYQATDYALKTHRKEKLDALQNALVSSVGFEQSSEDVGFQLLRLVDELTPTHLAILKCIQDHEATFAKVKNLEDAYCKFTEATGQPLARAVFESFVHDLESKLLIRESELGSPSSFTESPMLILDPDPIRPLKLTSMARDFLNLISAK